MTARDSKGRFVRNQDTTADLFTVALPLPETAPLRPTLQMNMEIEPYVTRSDFGALPGELTCRAAYLRLFEGMSLVSAQALAATEGPVKLTPLVVRPWWDKAYTAWVASLLVSLAWLVTVVALLRTR